MEKHVEYIKMPKFKVPGIKNEILWGFEFLKTKKICMEKVAGEQDLALQQHFP